MKGNHRPEQDVFVREKTRVLFLSLFVCLFVLLFVSPEVRVGKVLLIRFDKA